MDSKKEPILEQWRDETFRTLDEWPLERLQAELAKHGGKGVLIRLEAAEARIAAIAGFEVGWLETLDAFERRALKRLEAAEARIAELEAMNARFASDIMDLKIRVRSGVRR